jgi:hypothetical protein
VKRKYGCDSSDHQKPTGQLVVVETAGFEMTIATLFGFALKTGFRSLWLTASYLS